MKVVGWIKLVSHFLQTTQPTHHRKFPGIVYWVLNHTLLDALNANQITSVHKFSNLAKADQGIEHVYHIQSDILLLCHIYMFDNKKQPDLKPPYSKNIVDIGSLL